MTQSCQSENIGHYNLLAQLKKDAFNKSVTHGNSPVHKSLPS